ncbi:hypothetical protein G7B40_021190 [Aetokthonos hydrillicola Thurmond2011]|jgi:xanthine dehydrogenase YagR molybdenum-binding subunit|uniref:Aldehyde oxidase/xanthine dehydrogenase a/b hammerhead domain-containing protein n=1 Tax=Aetokthonos hydrillicola Thurmond2011 TaxID=2712845 RepID=A0AAP5MAP5_9CYAN|nr:hypothetical protein [Aetokthonos hydrillicola]MBO3458632.1 hypothetical protein [Aetokthonos hydrillicola CCALA 1050]MBW4587985.1 hypothetical protein [Aetokthonos hydrillicola CCALA 1050]MDR9897062.1 hypothetical protein [Aetokthonos hydrillicola Thurmond2011]
MNPVIGKAIDRVDGRLKVTGGAHYCAEIPIPDLVHAVLINSAIANAVYHATGKRIRELPITLDKLL